MTTASTSKQIDSQNDQIDDSSKIQGGICQSILPGLAQPPRHLMMPIWLARKKKHSGRAGNLTEFREVDRELANRGRCSGSNGDRNSDSGSTEKLIPL